MGAYCLTRLSPHAHRGHNNPPKAVSYDPMTTALAFSIPRSMNKHMLTFIGGNYIPSLPAVL